MPRAPADGRSPRKAAALAQEHAGNAELAELFDKISQKIAVQGMEALIPALRTSELVTLPELMPEGTHTIVTTPAAVKRRAVDLAETGKQFMEAGWEVAAMGGSMPLDGVAYLSFEGLQQVK